VNDIIVEVQPFTLTSPERIAALCHAVEYISCHKIAGDIVECGVWRGGSMMAVAKTLLRYGDVRRKLHLFDTFEGMTPPTEIDRKCRDGVSAAAIMATNDRSHGIWCCCPLEEVQHNLACARYPMRQISFIKGRVEHTLPAQAPASIALLRLDTDWYESTKHELTHLYPRLSAGGVLIVDDYGHWEGARAAVDEYVRDNDLPILLNRIDYTGRIAMKPAA